MLDRQRKTLSFIPKAVVLTSKSESSSKDTTKPIEIFQDDISKLTKTKCEPFIKEMEALDVTFPEYGFAKHKGYPTKLHFEMLNRYGVTPFHRTSFKPVQKILNQGSKTQTSQPKTGAEHV